MLLEERLLHGANLVGYRGRRDSGEQSRETSSNDFLEMTRHTLYLASRLFLIPLGCPFAAPLAGPLFAAFATNGHTCEERFVDRHGLRLQGRFQKAHRLVKNLLAHGRVDCAPPKRMRLPRIL